MKGTDRWAGVAALSLIGLLGSAPASAHHVVDGTTPSSSWQGLLSGLAHPVVGLDHLAFVLAAGMIAALHRRGLVVPLAFAAASLAGTGLHVLGGDLPGAQWLVASSIVLMGALLVARSKSLVESFPAVVVFTAVSGILHGYAYGESIVGAEMTPLGGYLLGLALVQIAIGLAARSAVFVLLRPTPGAGRVSLRRAGYAVSAVGLAFLGASWYSG
jgi:urease accessory protein